MEALDRTGEGWCKTCGQTVIDLTRGVVPVGRVIQCARVLVVATAMAGCGGSPAKAREIVVLPRAAAIEQDGGKPAEAPTSADAMDVVFVDDPLTKAMAATGGVVVSRP